ncbi:hypothetical protein M0R19_03720 [Candidatus Pacearchaeota archaeon]|jgi:hypothetical protein|nr:hypothetical protein [Candidatus Pacearchaeota archaeon]
MNIFDAIEENNIQSVKECIKSSADIHAHNALRWAIELNRFEIIKYLISLYTFLELKILFFKTKDLYIKYLILEQVYESS